MQKVEELRRETERLPGLLQGVNKAHELLGSVGDGDVVVFAL